MLSVLHVRKKDLVQVMSGKNKKKTGKILRVDHKHGRIIVEKVNLVKRHTKANGKAPGGIIEKEAPLYASVVLLFCDKCARGVRTATKVLESGKKTRVCKKCDTNLDK